MHMSLLSKHLTTQGDALRIIALLLSQVISCSTYMLLYLVDQKFSLQPNVELVCQQNYLDVGILIKMCQCQAEVSSTSPSKLSVTL